MQYKMQSHAVLMYSAGYEKPQKNSIVVKRGNNIPQPNEGILTSGGLKSASKSVTGSAKTDIK